MTYRYIHEYSPLACAVGLILFMNETLGLRAE